MNVMNTEKCKCLMCTDLVSASLIGRAKKGEYEMSTDFLSVSLIGQTKKGEHRMSVDFLSVSLIGQRKGENNEHRSCVSLPDWPNKPQIFCQ